MPRNYEKVAYHSYDKATLEINKRGKCSLKTITERFDIPDQTLRDNLRKGREKRSQIFGNDDESVLKKYIVKLNCCRRDGRLE